MESTNFGRLAAAWITVGMAFALAGGRSAAQAAPPSNASGAPGFSADDKIPPEEKHFAHLVQLTHGGQNAEGYWSPDSRELIFQSTRPPFSCDQIFRQAADGKTPAQLVSTGKGRTTCSYFMPDGEHILYSSTHAADPACPTPVDRSHGYVWPVYDTYEIWTARPDGSDLHRLTENHAYDAETTVCPKDGTLLFTSDRDGDLELYTMKPDGTNVKRITHNPGYDGGAFFSPDCSKIVWRASRPQGKDLSDYQTLLAQHLVRPGKLEIWTANADGTDARQLTYLNAASFAPSFFPNGKRIIFSSNYGDPSQREFELWAVDVDGSHLERITHSPGFDGFPMFSPDGKWLAFASNRGQGHAGETDLFVADWRELQEAPPVTDGPPQVAIANDFMREVTWLSDPERAGRGIGTPQLASARDYVARLFGKLGLEPAGDQGAWAEGFSVPVAVDVEDSTSVRVGRKALDRSAYQPAGFSGVGTVEAGVVPVGYGIVAPELGVDDYKGLDVHGKMVLIRRFVPSKPAFDRAAEKKYSDLRYKAHLAREHGAVGVLIADLADSGGSAAEEAPLPRPAIDAAAANGDAGLPVVVVTRSVGESLLAKPKARVALTIHLHRREVPAANVVGRIRSTAPNKLPGVIVIGAHYDHLGLGGRGSLAPGSHLAHLGADDNASGTAALIEIARQLVQDRSHLRRDVVIAAFSGEEEGVLGSTAFTRHPPAGLAIGDVSAMLNLDMVGRLRDDHLSILGGESAAEWHDIVPAACDRALLSCSLGGDGYGPSDHSPFYAAGVPVLHFFTGTHDDYHRPSDTAAKINAAGAAQVVLLVADVARELSSREATLTYRNAPAPPPAGDSRSYGASLGTVPDYAGDGRPGVLLGGVHPGGSADQAGMKRGDLLVSLAGSTIRDIYDFMFILQRFKPGDHAKAVIDRQGTRMELEVVFGTARPR
jgi:Tol biopolymer transport system component